MQSKKFALLLAAHKRWHAPVLSNSTINDIYITTITKKISDESLYSESEILRILLDDFYIFVMVMATSLRQKPQ